MDNFIYAFGSLYYCDLRIPIDLLFSGAGRDFAAANPGEKSDAEYYGEKLAEMNPEASMKELRAELSETGLDKDWDAEDDATVWQYVAWFIATDEVDAVMFKLAADQYYQLSTWQDEEGYWYAAMVAPGCLPDEDVAEYYCDTEEEAFELLIDRLQRESCC